MLLENTFGLFMHISSQRSHNLGCLIQEVLVHQNIAHDVYDSTSG